MSNSLFSHAWHRRRASRLVQVLGLNDRAEFGDQLHQEQRLNNRVSESLLGTLTGGERRSSLAAPRSPEPHRSPRPSSQFRRLALGHLGWLTIGICLALTGAVTAQNAPRDFVYLYEGSPISGEIAEMSPAGIVINTRGAKREVPLEQIERLTWGGEPPGLNRGRDLLRTGQVEAALEELEKLKPGSFTRAEVEQDWKVHLGIARAEMALRGSGDPKQAGRELAAFVKQFPQSIHRLKVSRTLGDLAVALGNHEGAVKYYNDLTESKASRFQLQGNLLQARAWQQTKQFDKALASYQRAQELAADRTEFALDAQSARIGMAACQAELGDADAAEKTLIELIRTMDNQQQLLFAQAYNALGAVYRRQQKPAEALLAYLRVHLLFPQDPATHAESLYFLRQLWTEQKRPDEATKVADLLQKRYANSPWAKLP